MRGLVQGDITDDFGIFRPVCDVWRWGQEFIRLILGQNRQCARYTVMIMIETMFGGMRNRQSLREQEQGHNGHRNVAHPQHARALSRLDNPAIR